MSNREWITPLGNGAFITVRYTLHNRKLVDYAVVLFIDDGSGTGQIVRVWDNAHGTPEMHRYTRTGGKQTATQLPVVDAGEAMRDAIQAAKGNHEEMIRSWNQ